MITLEILQLCKKHQQRIVTAESCTGGMIAAQLTDPPGASAIFDRGFVTYSNAAKIEQLGVKQSSLALHGAVSEQVAEEMAKGALENSNATIALSVTGIAGPGGSDHKPEGLVWFAISTLTRTTSVEVQFSTLGRHLVRSQAANYGLGLLARTLCNTLEF